MAGKDRPADMDSTKMKFGKVSPRTSMSTVAKVSGGPVESKGPKVAARTPGGKHMSKAPKGDFLD